MGWSDYFEREPTDPASTGGTCLDGTCTALSTYHNGNTVMVLPRGTDPAMSSPVELGVCIPDL